MWSARSPAVWTPPWSPRLLHKAIGKNLHCIFVDNGVLRSGEGDEVVTYLREHFDLNLKLVNAQRSFPRFARRGRRP